MVRNPLLRFVIFMALVILFQRALGYALSYIGLTGLAYFIVFELIMAFVFAYLYYPAPYRKDCLKNPKFHMTVAGFFAVFVVLELLF